MVKLIAACSPILVAVSVATAAVGGQEPPRPVTAVGCITRNGAVDVDKGVRVLNMEPNGLALTAARVTGSGPSRPSAVPGSQPQGTDSGTIPRQTIVGGRSDQPPDTLSFALTGAPVKALGAYVGRRVEVVGRVIAPADAAEPRGTAGTTRGAAPPAGGGTREERPAEGAAHPSAELPKLEVESFRAATGPCE